MPTIVYLAIDGRILAWLGGYVWDLGRFDDCVVPGDASTCTPQHWSKRPSQHVGRFSLATRNIVNTLAAFDSALQQVKVGFRCYTCVFWTVFLLLSSQTSLLEPYVRGMRRHIARWKEEIKARL